MRETHNHISDLHASVIDVVLHVDFPSRKAQQADERVAKNCVAQVADVGGLVGIDAGVLYQNFSRRNFGSRFAIGDQNVPPSTRDQF